MGSKFRDQIRTHRPKLVNDERRLVIKINEYTAELPNDSQGTPNSV